MTPTPKELNRQSKTRLRLLAVTLVAVTAFALSLVPSAAADSATDAANATAAATATVAIIPALLNALGPSFLTLGIYGFVLMILFAIPAALIYMVKNHKGLFK